MPIRIDALDAGLASRQHEVPAMKDGATVKLTVGAILDLVLGVAPGQLDTLEELAAALNDDADFAATLTAALALKANAEDVSIEDLSSKSPPSLGDAIRIYDSLEIFGEPYKKLTFADLRAWVLSIFNASGSAPVYACRAWVNFNGTGTVAIRGSGNVSSITDNGTGDYTVNFTTSMPDANYCVASSASSNSDPAGGSGFSMTVRGVSTTLAGSVRVVSGVSNSLYDVSQCHIAIFR